MRSDSAKKCLPIPQIRGGDICFLHILSLLGNVVSTSEVIFKYSARARWNTYEEDSRFFFGENARSHGSRSRFRKKSSKEMAKFESVWIRGQYGLSKGHWIFYIIFLYNHAFFTVKRLLAQIVTFCAPRDFARSFVIWLYINLRSANYIKEVDLNLFYEREIIPVFRLRERL
jgi:hypothetical protein